MAGDWEVLILLFQPDGACDKKGWGKETIYSCHEINHVLEQMPSSELAC